MKRENILLETWVYGVINIRYYIILINKYWPQLCLETKCNLSSQLRISPLLNSLKHLLNILRKITLLKDLAGLTSSRPPPVHHSFYTVNQLAPLDDDWVYYRVASLARKIYVRPRSGVRLLSHIYGGKKRMNNRNPRHEHASTKIIRWGLQQLEKQKIIKKDKKGDGLKLNSRIISDEGRRTLNRIATEHIKSKRNWFFVLSSYILIYIHLILIITYVCSDFSLSSSSYASPYSPPSHSSVDPYPRTSSCTIHYLTHTTH